ncbi:hypothetical protein M501DRAFT_1000959 [Patellaria atrata CBS 101060]|uniref:GYF domain-containing protein n=1 Tax=Patellaria atrata CBS 101060 TaxID=1346257 RepID=A0A9P4SG38_9PEZI|nr:hypothetical protein M501DRAFT_1000959 [Patellaria atrata CBS 101060]
MSAKRGGGPFSYAGDESSEPSSKKLRFDTRNPSTLAADAAEEDAILELDEIGKGAQTKRNAVKIDGYESDSSTENFDQRADDKARAAKAATRQKSKEEDEGDMFADLDDEFADGDDDEDLSREGKQKKSVKFLDEDEIEGQVSNSKSGGHVSADFTGKGKERKYDDTDSSSDSGGDEGRDRIDSDMDEEIGAGGKKKHAPKLDAFNMKNENEEGRFDEHGNYVRKAVDPDAVHDRWLEGITKRDMKKAKEAQERREDEQRRKNKENDALLTSDLLAALIPRLKKTETPMEALQRLEKSKPKRKPKQRSDMDPQTLADAKVATDAINAICDAANGLIHKGFPNVYDEPREKLTRIYAQENDSPWEDPLKNWEYRPVEGGGQIHGPYDSKTMQAWSDAGYFAEGTAQFREAGDVPWLWEVDDFE